MMDDLCKHHTTPTLRPTELESVRDGLSAGTLETLRQSRILLAGGTGFFGSWLVESFCELNATLGLEAKMTVLSRDPERVLQRRPFLHHCREISFVAGDVRQISAGSFCDPHFTHIIHAASTSSSVIPGEELFLTILDGTRALLALAAAQERCRFLYLSSGAIYGPQPKELERVGESFCGGPDLRDPGAAYAEAKRAAEMLCTLALAKEGLEVVVARCFAFVGPHLPLDTHFAIGNFLGDVLAHRPIRVRGDGTAVRSYLYAADLTLWLWTLLLQGQTGQAYNVGSPEAITVGELARLIDRLRPQPLAEPSVIMEKQPDAAGGGGSRYVPDIRRAEAELGLKVRTPLEEGLRRTLAWHQSWCGMVS